MAKKVIDSGTQGRTFKVFKSPIDLTGINIVRILDKCPDGQKSALQLHTLEIPQWARGKICNSFYSLNYKTLIGRCCYKCILDYFNNNIH